MRVPALAAVVATGLTLAAATACVPADAATATHAAARCNVFSYTGAHWGTTIEKSAVVTHSYQLNLPRNGTYQETKTESLDKTVSSSVKASASVKYSEDAIFESVEVKAGVEVAHWGSKTSSKSVTDTVTIHNTGGQAEYIMFEGVTRFTGIAEYYNCVADTKSGVGTVKITNRVPWETYAGGGGGAVQCGASTDSALAEAAKAYC